MTKELIIIDPTKMTEVHRLLLSYFIHCELGSGSVLFNKHCTYQFPPLPFKGLYAELFKNIMPPVFIRLTHKIAERQSLGNPNECRYEIFGQELGKGGFGYVEEIIGTLKFGMDGLLIYKKTERVGKFEINSNHHPNFEKNITAEYLLSRRAPYLHSKPPTFFLTNGKEYSLLVMRRLFKENLRQTLNADRVDKEKGINKISTDIRIELSIQLLNALKKLHQQKIIHGDIKSANVIVNLEATPVSVYIIDFGGSQEISGLKAKSSHTICFAPPEWFNHGEFTEASDIFSMGCLLALIWRANEYRPTTWQEAIEMASTCYFVDLFAGIKDLSLYFRTIISMVIHSMVHPKPSERCQIDYALSFFHKIQIERKLRAYEPKLRAFTESAYYHGVQLHDELNALAVSFQSHDEDALKKLHEVIAAHLRRVHPFSDRVNEFVDRLDIQVFKGLTTKNAILDKMTTVLTHFLASKKKIHALYDSIIALLSHVDSGQPVDPNLSIYQSRLERMLETPDPPTVDNVAELTRKYDKYWDLIAPILEKAGEIVENSINNNEIKNENASNNPLLLFTGQPAIDSAKTELPEIKIRK